MKKYAFIIVFMGILIDSANAQTRLSCAALGYTQTIAECDGLQSLKCPYDANQVFCSCNQCEGCVCKASYTLGRPDIYDGIANTEKLLDVSKENALVANIARKYYPVAPEGSAINLKNDTIFGQGRWYVPSIGELVEAVYSHSTVKPQFDASSCDSGSGYCQPTNVEGYSPMFNLGADTHIWSSTVWIDSGNKCVAWVIDPSAGLYADYHYAPEYEKAVIVPFLTLENCFIPTGCRPKVGDLLLSDKTWRNPSEYHDYYISGKTVYYEPSLEADDPFAVGVVTKVFDDGRITIMSLFAIGGANSEPFNPDQPYYESSILEPFFKDCTPNGSAECPTPRNQSYDNTALVEALNSNE